MGGKILDYEAKDILNRGRREGRMEGRQEGIVAPPLASIRSLMKKLHMTAGEAMNALDIPPAEQEKYATLL